MNFTSLIKESKETHENSMNLTNPMNLMSPSRENKYMMINNANKYESPHIEVALNSSELFTESGIRNFTIKRNSKDDKNLNYFSPTDDTFNK